MGGGGGGGGGESGGHASGWSGAYHSLFLTQEKVLGQHPTGLHIIHPISVKVGTHCLQQNLLGLQLNLTSRLLIAEALLRRQWLHKITHCCIH